MKNIYKLKAYGKCFELTAVKHIYCVDDSLAIELVDNKSHECFAMLTVNLSESMYCKLPEDVQAVDINNCPWAEDFIKENNLGKPLGITVHSGYCDYPLYKFDLSKLISDESPSESNESPSELLEYILYGEMCTYCPNAKRCHEECEYCDDFLAKQSEVDNIYITKEVTMMNNLTEVTVFIVADGVQFTVSGHVKPIDTVGCEVIEEITEVVDDYLVHCYTLVPGK